jgi:hypothetical protein
MVKHFDVLDSKQQRALRALAAEKRKKLQSEGKTAGDVHYKSWDEYEADICETIAHCPDVVNEVAEQHMRHVLKLPDSFDFSGKSNRKTPPSR